MKRSWNPTPSPRPSPESASPLPRARTGGSESIRGRISGPIPIPSPMDDEFPMRQPGTGIAKPLDEMEDKPPPQVEPQMPEPEKQSPASPTVASSHPAVARGVTPDPDVIPSSEPRPGTVVHDSPGRRTNQSSTLRYSAISQDTSNSSRGRPQRKKSTLRGALGRLFGRKKKKTGSESTISEEKPVHVGSNQHRSDPTALNRAKNNGENVESNRSTSMPITEYSRALRSHSVGPEDVMAIESARNSLSADLSFSRVRSGGVNTTQLLGLRRTTDGGLTGLSPRPASTHGRSSELVYNTEDPEQIGRAVTSDISGLKRRSRSLSGLPAVENDEGKLRRRSDEIRYWRESHGALTSPVSSNMPESEYPGFVTFDVPESRADLPPKTPPQPFTFDITTMNEMAGMKITHAASMETRIGSLEARTRRLEKVVTQLCNAVPNFRPDVDNPPETAPPAVPEHHTAHATTTTTSMDPFAYRHSAQDALGSTRPSTRHSELSKMSSVDAPTFVGSFHRPPGPQVLGPSKRPLSNATIRGAASLPTLSREMAAPFTIDHYMTLMALIETERSARLALEAEVRKLGHQLTFVSRSSAYAHPARGDGAATGISLGETSAFDEDDEDDEGTATGAAKSKRGSMLPEDSGIGAGYNDDGMSEPFATPREESWAFSPPGASDLDEDEAKKAARTLSLSQLTYNTTPPALTQERAPQPI